MQRKFELMLSQFKIHENLLNSGLYCYYTNIVFLKSEIKLNVFMIDKEKGNLEDNLHIVTDQINCMLGNMDYIEDEIRRSHLIDLKNNNWLEEGEKEISPKQFMKRISLISISFDIKDNELFSANLEYDDGDIFWGHTINVEIVDRKVNSIEI